MTIEKEVKADKKAEKELLPDYKALAVFNCEVKAEDGKGFKVAIVRGKSGGYRLFGTRAIARNTGLLSLEVANKVLSASVFASSLGCPIIRGKDAVLKWLSDNKIPDDAVNGIPRELIISDLTTRSTSDNVASKTGRSKVDF